MGLVRRPAPPRKIAAVTAKGNDAGASFFHFGRGSQRHELPLIPGLKSWPRAICSARAVVVPFHKHGKVLKSLPISANEPKAVVVLRGTLAIGLAMGV